MGMSRFLLVPVVLAAATTAFGADKIKIGTIDTRRIVQESSTGKDATKDLTKSAEKLEKGLKAKEAELQKMKEALDAQGSKLSMKERSAREKELQKKLNQYKESLQNAQKKLVEKEEDFSRKLMEKVEAALKEYAPKNGYAAVARKNNLVYTNETTEVTDITEDIMKAIEAQK